jgi:carbamate kinase
VRVVAALGGNALLERGEKPDADIQEHQDKDLTAARLARAVDADDDRLGSDRGWSQVVIHF